MSTRLSKYSLGRGCVARTHSRRGTVVPPNRICHVSPMYTPIHGFLGPYPTHHFKRHISWDTIHVRLPTDRSIERRRNSTGKNRLLLYDSATRSKNGRRPPCTEGLFTASCACRLWRYLQQSNFPKMIARRCTMTSITASRKLASLASVLSLSELVWKWLTFTWL